VLDEPPTATGGCEAEEWQRRGEGGSNVVFGWATVEEDLLWAAKNED
jgi:hypothetical protein